MTSFTIDFSGMTQMPDIIRVKLSGGAIVEFELPSFKKAEAPRPKTIGFRPKPTGFRPRKFFNSTRNECDFGILCTKKVCNLTHPTLEYEKQAIFNGSPEDVHEYIKELYEAFDDHHLRVFINTIKHGKFIPYQNICDDDLKCEKTYCARKHEQGDKKMFENISERAIEAIQVMGFKIEEESS